ncbi:hypothetical protein KY290_028285 [Solanum tuberosum]|uniref:Uncharacterized protein n=1 Tax=Solanum tuberosum TaxID=4113 RepID=A0ABQ7UIN4_SOLTU|nr:hypothetical protein KY284_027263 [Solanum tuberosum]KAH0749053.1 hypothetical protein KY290_028285 [Solanum tuberosum]
MGDLVHTVQFVFGIFGNAASLFLFLVPMYTFKRIIKNKSTEQFSGIPYVMTLLNCLLTAWRFFCGMAATIITVVMYASPLSNIRLVIRTKSVEYMPFFLSFAVVVSCTNWFIYGMLGMDLFIGISTCIGLILGVVQLILYFIYRDKKTSTVVDEFQYA